MPRSPLQSATHVLDGNGEATLAQASRESAIL